MNRDHSVVFEIASKYCILDSFVDYEGYSISLKGFLPTVVDIMVIWVKFTHSGPFYFTYSQNVNIHSCRLLFDHFQFALICGPNSWVIILFIPFCNLLNNFFPQFASALQYHIELPSTPAPQILHTSPPQPHLPPQLLAASDMFIGFIFFPVLNVIYLVPYSRQLSQTDFFHLVICT